MKLHNICSRDQGNIDATHHHDELSFHEIYEAISKQVGLTRDELKFLRRIIQRKLREFNQHLNQEALRFRPYNDFRVSHSTAAGPMELAKTHPF